jgi:hypothetical protein
MSLPNLDDVVDIVRLDILAGLAGLDADGNPIGDAASKAGAGRPIFLPRSDDSFEGRPLTERGADIEVVEWVYRCTHGGNFPGIQQTNRDLDIEGVTIVERANEDAPLRRYVDWSRVMAQLGVSATFRPAVDTLSDLPGW